jgi:hypothetical protein
MSLLVPATASGASHWRASQPLGGTTVAITSGPEVAVSPNGHVAVVWTTSDGDLHIARRKPGQAFGPVVTPPWPEPDLGIPDLNKPFSEAHVAVNEQGDVAVVAAGSDSKGSYYCDLVARSGAPLPALNSTSGSGPNGNADCFGAAAPVAVAIDAARTVWVASAPSEGTATIPIYRIPLQGEADFLNPMPNTGITGDAIYSLTADAGKADHVLFAAEITKAGDSTFPRALVMRADGSIAGSGQSAQPTVALDRSDRVMYAEQGRTGGVRKVWVKTLKYDEGIGIAKQVDFLDPSSFAAGEPRAAIAENGQATVVWQEAPSASTRLIDFYETRIAADGSDVNGGAVAVGGEGPVDDQFPYADPHVAMSASGAGLALWRREAANQHEIASAWDPPGGAAAPAFTPSGLPSGQASVSQSRPWPGVDDMGNGFAAWTAGGSAVRYAELDQTKPSLKVDVAAIAVKGKPAKMKATVHDLPGAGGATVRWRFGDGAGATGPSVQHTYKSTGTRTVSATATDAVGNATKVTRTIKVVAAEPKAKPRKLIRFGKRTCSPASKRNRVAVKLGGQKNVALAHAEIRAGEVLKTYDGEAASGKKRVKIAPQGKTKVAVKVVTVGGQKAKRSKRFTGCGAAPAR